MQQQQQRQKQQQQPQQQQHQERRPRQQQQRQQQNHHYTIAKPENVVITSPGIHFINNTAILRLGKCKTTSKTKPYIKHVQNKFYTTL